MAELLGVQPATLDRWERYGLPTRQSRLLAIAQTLAAAVTAGEKAAATEKGRAERIEAIAEGRYSRKARRSAARALQKALDELEKRNAVCRIRKSAVVQLANELPVGPGKLRRWLRDRELPVEQMPLFSHWAQSRAEDQIAIVQEKAESEEHIQAAKRPGYQLGGRKDREKRKAEQTVSFITETRKMNSEIASGWWWSWKVERWLTAELLESLIAKAQGAEPPRAFWALDYWIVTALVSIRHRPGGELHYSQRFRQFGARQSKKSQRAAVLVNLNAPISSGRMGPGSSATIKRRAIEAFRKEMVQQLCGLNLVFVQGLEVRNYKLRTHKQRASWRESRAWKRQVAERKAEREKQRAKASRARARAKDRAASKAAKKVGKKAATKPRKGARRK